MSIAHLQTARDVYKAAKAAYREIKHAYMGQKGLALGEAVRALTGHGSGCVLTFERSDEELFGEAGYALPPGVSVKDIRVKVFGGYAEVHRAEVHKLARYKSVVFADGQPDFCSLKTEDLDDFVEIARCFESTEPGYTYVYDDHGEDVYWRDNKREYSVTLTWRVFYEAPCVL